MRTKHAINWPKLIQCIFWTFNSCRNTSLFLLSLPAKYDSISPTLSNFENIKSGQTQFSNTHHRKFSLSIFHHHNLIIYYMTYLSNMNCCIYITLFVACCVSIKDGYLPLLHQCHVSHLRDATFPLKKTPKLLLQFILNADYEIYLLFSLLLTLSFCCRT